MKRLFDVLLSGAALILLAPLMLILAILIRLRLGAPVLFRQVRPGFDGRPFLMLKFRSMTDAQSLDGEPLSDEERLTPFGRWLRASSLDELPELWNILRGDMSLVGPRPLLMEYLPLYNDEQRRRHSVRPGMTGWAQIHGRNALSWEEKFSLDIWYVDNRSFALDMRILLKTLSAVLRSEGISKPGHSTTDFFKGSKR